VRRSQPGEDALEGEAVSQGGGGNPLSADVRADRPEGLRERIADRRADTGDEDPTTGQRRELERYRCFHEFR
jgi:hypothetical protein